MYKQLIYLLILASLVQGYVRKCYSCSSLTDENCDNDNFEKSEEYAAKCVQLDYRGGKRSYSKYSNIFVDFFLKERHSLPITSMNIYKCVKANIEYDDTKTEVIRTCLPLRTTGNEECEFIRQNISHKGYKITGCHECDSNKCNSSNKLTISLLLYASVVIKLII